MRRFGLGLLVVMLLTSCAEAVGLRRMDANEEGAAKSFPSEAKAQITFVNKSGQKAKVHWLDFSGNRVLYKILEAGESYDQQTYLTHPWLVTDGSDNAWNIFFADAHPRIAYIVVPDALVARLPLPGIAQGQGAVEEQAACNHGISAKVGDAVLQSICESRPGSLELRHKIVISRLHPAGSGVETLAEFPFERECEWSSNWSQLSCDSRGWSPLAGAVYRKSSVNGCKSAYLCQTGCGGVHTPKQLTVIDMACQYAPRS